MPSATQARRSASIGSHLHTVESYSTIPPLNLMGPNSVLQIRESSRPLETMSE